MKTARRAAYVKTGDIIRQLREWFQSHPQEAAALDYVSLAGSGEPTLHQDIGSIIAAIKELTPAPVALLSNGSLFRDSGVRAAVKNADVIIPSLDAGTQEIFEEMEVIIYGFVFAHIPSIHVKIRYYQCQSVHC